MTKTNWVEIFQQEFIPKTESGLHLPQEQKWRKAVKHQFEV